MMRNFSEIHENLIKMIRELAIGDPSPSFFSFMSDKFGCPQKSICDYIFIKKDTHLNSLSKN